MNAVWVCPKCLGISPGEGRCETYTNAGKKRCSGKYTLFVQKDPYPIIPDGTSLADLEKEVKRMHPTFVQGLLRALIEAAYEKKLFKPGGASLFTRTIEVELKQGLENNYDVEQILRRAADAPGLSELRG